ncbi:MAG: hypothetical protein LC733_11195 [Actinobacteria bacterium]|nr:hypothetical protein [Actinomycetota bacterium]
MPPVLRMDRPSSEPGGVVVLRGEGCSPGAPVAVVVGDVAVGSIPGLDDGSFVAILTLPDFGPGRYDIDIDCGATSFTIPMDVVVATSVESPNSVLALFIFFVLLILVLFRRRRIHRPAPGRMDDAGGDFGGH